MTQQTMYPGVANSPQTEIATAISATATSITVQSAADTVLPAAPNLATIGVDESAETIYYAGKTGNTLTGVVRGFDGTVARAWGVGARVARMFTRYDYEALRGNVAALSESAAIQAAVTAGPNIIETTQATPATVEFKGRTLVNLPGKDGGCESLTPFTLESNIPTLSTTQINSGSASIRCESKNNTGSSFYKDFDSVLDKAKQYVMIAAVYIESYGTSDAPPVVGLRDKGTMTSRYSVNIDTGKLGVWQFPYVKIPKNNVLVGDGFRLRVGNTSNGTGVVTYFDSIRLYEVSDADYAAIGTTIIGDAIDRLFPYVDSVQHAQGLSLRTTGKNLLPPFLQQTPSSQSNVSWIVTQPYTMELSATVVNGNIAFNVPVVPNTNYTFACDCGSDGQISVLLGSTQVASYSNQPRTFNSGDNTVTRLFFRSTAIGTVKFTNPMLVLGNVDQLPPSFEPRQDSYINAPTLLASNVDGSIADTYDSTTKQVFRRWMTGFKVDNSKQWVLAANYTGYRVVRTNGGASPTPITDGLLNYVKFNSVVGKRIVDFTTSGADAARVYNGEAYISVDNVESGWIDLSPNTNAVKALMNGWKATANNGTVYTSWVSILTGTAPPTNTEAYVAANKAPGWDAWATLDYVRATPITETLSGDLGGISLPNGAIQVELMDGVIVREKANPKLYSGYYYINNTAASITTSKLNYRLDSLISVYKNDIADKWELLTGNANGNYTMRVPAADFDPTATYYVTYRVLDRHQYTAGARQAVVTYQSSIGSVVAKNAQNIAELQRKDGVQDFALDYIEAKADNNAIDLVTHTTLTDGAHGSTSAATANRIIQRDAAGRAKVAAPAAADDIARKAEVDAALPKDGSQPMTGPITSPGGKFTANPIIEGTIPRLVLTPNNNTSNSSAGIMFRDDTGADKFVLGRQMNNGNLIVYDYEATKSRLAMVPNGDTSIVAGNTNGSINLTTTGTGQAKVNGNQIWDMGNNAAEKAKNGYQKLASGVIIQWGETSLMNSGDTKVVTFPIAFPTACVCVSPSPDYAGYCAVNLMSRTSATFNQYAGSSGNTRWIAIGY